MCRWNASVFFAGMRWPSLVVHLVLHIVVPLTRGSLCDGYHPLDRCREKTLEIKLVCCMHYVTIAPSLYVIIKVLLLQSLFPYWHCFMELSVTLLPTCFVVFYLVHVSGMGSVSWGLTNFRRLMLYGI